MLLAIFVTYAVVLSIALGRAGFRHRQPQRPAHARPRPARVLVVGATGGTGRELVAQALARGYEVTALARNPSPSDVRHERLTVVRGDVLDEASLAAAVPGHDAVVSALGHKRFFYPSRILSAGTANLLRAMEAGGRRRFVCVTSLGIGDSAGRLGLLYTFFVIPVVLPFYFWDKAKQERAIAASGADWVIVRPGLLHSGAKRGRPEHGRHAGGWLLSVRISRADVAAFMLDQLESDTYTGSAPGLCG